MDIKSRELAARGSERILWAQRSMPVLGAIRRQFEREKPLSGVRVAACLHVTTETAVLVQTLEAGGAQVQLCASNPLSTQDDVAASLVEHDEIGVHAIHGADRETYNRHLNAVLEHRPHIVMDDGADLVKMLHADRKELLAEIIGGTEETTSGVNRLRSMARESVLKYPVFAVNDADTKHLFDNRYGTGQSTIDGILRATNRLLAGSTFVVSGYGWCGKGVARRAAGMGARVIVTEVEPLRALEAVMDGFQVLPIVEAAAIGEIFCTTTGNRHVIDRPSLERLKDGAILCNAGHFNVELNLDALAAMSTSRRQLRDNVEAFYLPDGRTIHLLGEGRLVNLAAAEGHPAEVMDMSFANQALCVGALVKDGARLEAGVHRVPRSIDRRVAQMKLDALGIGIDTLTEAQEAYLRSWESGT